MSSGNALMVLPEPKPIQLTLIDGTRKEGEGKRGGVWRVTWSEGQNLCGGWDEAITFLDSLVRVGQISGRSVILAGSYAAPWILDDYLEAAEAVETGYVEGATDAYARSASKLYEVENNPYKEQLTKMWDGMTPLEAD